jgi:hypothetical protein
MYMYLYLLISSHPLKSLRIEKTTTYGVRHPGSWLGTGNKNVAVLNRLMESHPLLRIASPTVI